MRKPCVLPLLAAAAVAAALAGCRGRDAPPPPSADAVEYRPVLRATSAPAARLTSVAGLDVDARGTIYVADNHEVAVLARDGRLLRRIGRQGQGPGEFQGVGGVRLLPGDSVFVFDAVSARVTVFPPASDRPAYTVNVGTGGLLFPYWVQPVPREGALLALYRAAYGMSADGGPRGHRNETMRLLNGDASLRRDSVLSFPEYEAVAFENNGARGVLWNPFGRRMLVAMGGQERVYTAWSGGWSIDVHSPSGRLLRRIRPAGEPRPRPIEPAERDSVVRMLANPYAPQAVVRRAMDAVGNRTWPMLQDLVVDDRGRIWLAVTGMRGEEVHWTAFDDAGRRVGGFDLPEGVHLHRIRGDVAYGVRLDADDVPEVVVYDLRPAGDGRLARR